MNKKDKDALLSRREFLAGLKKWSKVVIASAIGISVASKADAGAWVNRYGGGGSWVNSGGGGWYNRGGSWLNGGGGGWINRYGGGGWINRY
jgi:hypothetical protein